MDFADILGLHRPRAAAQAPAENRSERDARMAWWRDARFGMFIHWGLYSIPGGVWKGRRTKVFPAEWIMCAKRIPDREYSKLAARFNPFKFDAEKWAGLAKLAGMKYMCFTAKHHEGFSMFRTSFSDYNIVDASPFGRDPIAELAGACRAQGVRFGLYYSQMDWHWSPLPSSFAPIMDFGRYIGFLKGQLAELLTNYGPIATLFFDGDWMPQWTPSLGRDIENHCRELQPGIIINNRVGKRPLLETAVIEQKPLLSLIPGGQAFALKNTAGDYETPEQYVAGAPPARDWETNMTMNTSWGFKSFDHDWKSATQIIHTLIDTASKGGNFLLNVGPDEYGEIPQPSVERLLETGKWLDVNGEAIYGTSAWKTIAEGDVRYTAKGNTLHAICLKHPGGTLALSAPSPGPGTEISLLGWNGPLPWKHECGKIIIDVPAGTRDMPPGHAYVFKMTDIR